MQADRAAQCRIPRRRILEFLRVDDRPPLRGRNDRAGVRRIAGIRVIEAEEKVVPRFLQPCADAVSPFGRAVVARFLLVPLGVWPERDFVSLDRPLAGVERRFPISLVDPNPGVRQRQ